MTEKNRDANIAEETRTKAANKKLRTRTRAVNEIVHYFGGTTQGETKLPMLKRPDSGRKRREGCV